MVASGLNFERMSALNPSTPSNQRGGVALFRVLSASRLVVGTELIHQDLMQEHAVLAGETLSPTLRHPAPGLGTPYRAYKKQSLLDPQGTCRNAEGL